MREGRPARKNTIFILLTLAAAVAVMASPAQAAGDISSLGPLTNATYPSLNFPLLGQFQRGGPNLDRGRLPEMVFVGTMEDGGSAAERWPIIKALDQFGRWSGLAAVSVTTSLGQEGVGTYPTFDWTHARFSSRYLSFDHKEYINRITGPNQRLSPEERRLLSKYKGNQVMVLSIGGYVLAGSGFPFGDLSSSQGDTLSFDTVQSALRKSDAGQYGAIVTEVNAETNVLVALICHADGRKPARVCNGGTIRMLLKHVR